MKERPSAIGSFFTFIGVLAAFLIMAGLVWAMYRYTHPAPLGEGRAELRRKNLTELRAAETNLHQYGWQDQGKGIVRLPIEQAMELTVREGHNPAAARSNLLARSAKASAPPPKAPAQPNPFD